jgi:hypothetical protein
MTGRVRSVARATPERTLSLSRPNWVLRAARVTLA